MIATIPRPGKAGRRALGILACIALGAWVLHSNVHVWVQVATIGTEEHVALSEALRHQLLT